MECVKPHTSSLQGSPTTITTTTRSARKGFLQEVSGCDRLLEGKEPQVERWNRQDQQRSRALQDSPGHPAGLGGGGRDASRKKSKNVNGQDR